MRRCGSRGRTQAASSGLLRGGGKGAASGSAAAPTVAADGRAGGEAGAESQTQGRLAAAMGMLGTGVGSATSIAHRAADIGSDVLGGAGVGSPGYSMTPTDERATRGNRSSGGAAQLGEPGRRSQPEAAPRSNEPPDRHRRRCQDPAPDRTGQGADGTGRARWRGGARCRRRR